MPDRDAWLILGDTFQTQDNSWFGAGGSAASLTNNGLPFADFTMPDVAPVRVKQTWHADEDEQVRAGIGPTHATVPIHWSHHRTHSLTTLTRACGS